VLVGEEVTLLESTKTNDYYHVTTAQDEKGWVWAHNVHVLAIAPTVTPAASVTGTPTPIAVATAVAPTPTPSGIATAIDSSWEKPAPVEITFHTTTGTCEPDGDPGSDTVTNHLKNRVDEPPSYHLVIFDAIVNLPRLPKGSPTTRDSTKWPNVAGMVTPYEGAPVSVEGFVAAVKQEGGEHTNCEFSDPTEVDWHIPLVKTAGDPEKLAIVVELTPRVRRNHSGWTATNLPANGSTSRFRISGWLMYDPDHPAQLYDPADPNKKNKFRQTLWEVHPVTKIEVWQNGAWVDLDHP
jgi:hypothetical protein